MLGACRIFRLSKKFRWPLVTQLLVLPRAMAELGPGSYRSADVATVLGVKLGGLGPVRAVLIRKGMIYSLEHGELAFTGTALPRFHAAGNDI
jgi:hypothetical protein